MTDEIVNKYKKGNKVLTIKYEEDPESPREWDNMGRIICAHKRYSLSDKNEDFNMDDYESWEEVATMLVDKKDAVLLKPIYMYDHSGITIKTTPFGCKWDSGQIGFIYCKADDILEEDIKSEEDAEKILLIEIDLYDKYLKGEIYRYTIEKITPCDKCKHEHTELLDSCGGFYDVDEILKETHFEDAEELE